MKKRFLSLLLTACMVLSIIPLSYVTVNADIAASPTLGNYYEGTWLGNDAAGNTLYDLSWYDTENANTYEISTAAGLAGLSYLIDTHKDEFVGKTVILTSDIDLGAYNWMPIDIWNDSRDEMDGLPGFRGLLDGNGKTISNMRIKSGFNGEIGLFGRLAGYVKDLTISGATIDIPTANASVAFFVGCLSNDTPSITATVENCKAVNSSINCAKSLTVDYIVGRTRLGGVVTGCSQEGCTINISNVTDWNSPYNSDFCDNYNSKTEFVINNELDLATIAYLSGKGKTFDGKTVAMNANLDMSRFDWVPLKVFSGTFSGNNKTITGLHTEAEITAAFIEEGVFCTVNNLTLEVDFHITNGGSVYAAVGGVIALARGSRIANCRVYGSVSSAPGDNAHAGGIVGQTSGWTVTIQNCVNYANVSGSYSGGICGHHASSKDATGLYMNCINLGNVTGISAPGVEAYAGGIVGRQTDSVRYDYCASMPEAVISAASDKGAAYIGGIVGAIYASGEVSTLTITNSFCTSELVGTGNSAYISGIFGYNKAYATIEQAYVEDCYFGGIINHNGSSINPDSSKCMLLSCNTGEVDLTTKNNFYFVKRSLNADGSAPLYSYENLKVTSDTDAKSGERLVSFGNNFHIYTELLGIPAIGAIPNPDGATETTPDGISRIYFCKTMQKNDTNPNDDITWVNAADCNNWMPYLTSLSHIGPDCRDLSINNFSFDAELSLSADPDSGLDKTPYDQFKPQTNPIIEYPDNGLVLRLKATCVTSDDSAGDQFITFSDSASKPLLKAGDRITMYTLNADKSGYEKEYSYTVRTGDSENYLLPLFTDANGNAYSATQKGTVLYFKVELANTVPDGSYFARYSQMSTKPSPDNPIYKKFIATVSAGFTVQKANDIVKVIYNKPANGSISFPGKKMTDGSVIGYTGSGGVSMVIIPDTGYMLEKATHISDYFSFEIPNMPAGGGSYCIEVPGQHEVVAKFVPQKLGVTFTGEGCTLCDAAGNPVDPTSAHVLYGEDYSFTVKSSSVIQSVSVNGAAITPDGSGVYTVTDNTDAVRIQASLKSAQTTTPLISGVPDSITYGDSFTLTASGGSGTGDYSWRSGNSSVATVNEDGDVTATGAETASIYLSKAGDDDYSQSAEVSVSITVSRKTVSITGLTVKDKTYDGGTAAEIDNAGLLDGLIGDDRVILVNGDCDFADANVGDSVAVTASGFGLTGDKAGNYSLSAQPTVPNAKINPKALTVSIEDVFINKGQAIPALTVSVSGFVNGEDESLTGFVLPTAQPVGTVDTLNTALTTIPVTVSGGTATGNYCFDTFPTAANISISTVSVDDNDFISDKPLNEWQNGTITITPSNGYSLISTDGRNWSATLPLTTEGDKSIGFYLKKADGTITEQKTISYKLDKTAPTGTISIGGNGWHEFLNTITFGLFFKDTQTVSITTGTELSGIAKVEYATSSAQLTLDEVKALTDWTEGDSTGVTPEDAKQFIYYAKIIDNAGNVTYLSTDGVEFDLTKSVIAGITDGETYYTTQTATVTDKNLASVTLNGANAASTLTLAGNVDKTYTIVATDKAGNVTTYTVTMKPISNLSAAIDSLTAENVKSTNKASIDGVKAATMAVDSTGATQTEKDELKAITDKCELLLGKIADTAAEIRRITDAVNGYDLATVKSSDKAAIETLVGDIDTLTATDNLTADEKTALGAVKASANGLLGKIADAYAAANHQDIKNVEGITKNNVKPGDKDALTKAKTVLEYAIKTYKKNYTPEELAALTEKLDIVNAALAELAKPVETEIPQTDNDDNPKTGDTGNIALWLALMFVSVGAVLTLGVTQKKRKNSAK